MAVIPLPFGKLVLDRPDKAIEKHSITSQSAYARYPAPGDSLRSSGPINNTYHVSLIRKKSSS
jgi:hypothetical protein